MAPAVARTLRITYGTFKVGGVSGTQTDYLIHGPVKIAKSYQRFSIEFQVLVQNDTASTFATNCANLEAAYRIPRQLITVEMEGATFISLDPSSNTGFLAEPTATKAGDARTDTGRSRLYNCSIVCQLPADLSGQSGRLDSTTTADFDASNRCRITIEGVYTALGGNSASAQYAASIGTFAAAQISSYGGGGTFDLVSEDKIPDDANKNCRFRRVYQQDLYAVTSGSLAHASIRNATCVYAISKPSPGDSPGKGVVRMRGLQATVTCNVDFTVSTSLKSLWESSIRPYLLSEVQRVFAPSFVIIDDERYAPDFTQNVVVGTLFLSLGGGSSTLSYVKSVEYDEDPGNLLQPAWDRKSRYAKYQHDGIAVRLRITTESERRVGVFDQPRSAPPSAGNWVVRRWKPAATVTSLGEGSDKSVLVTDLVSMLVEEYFDRPSGASGGPVTTPGGGNGSQPGFTAPGGAVTPGIDRGAPSGGMPGFQTPPGGGTSFPPTDWSSIP
jgi:hypothetical protein